MPSDDERGTLANQAQDVRPFRLYRRRESVTAQEVIDRIMATSQSGLAISEINKAIDHICRKD